MGLYSGRARASRVPSERGSGSSAATGRWSQLAILLLIYLTSSMDRMVISIAGEPIKQELGLADWQLGVLNGLAFSALYAGLGLPLARLADRGNRVTIIAICLAVWSAMTALCGLALNFTQLILCRMGVGIGEAGCVPASHSIISDYFPPSKRTTALALFGLGLPLGGLLSMSLGGVIIDRFGWRSVFFLLGLPGLLLAVVARLLLKEPARINDPVPTDPAQDQVGEPARTEALRAPLLYLARSPVARNILIGMTLATFFSSPSSSFLAPYMARRFGLSYAAIGAMLSVAVMGGMAISTFWGGLAADWLAKRDRRWYLWLSAGSLLCGTLIFALAIAQPTSQSLFAVLMLSSLFGAAFTTPCYALLYTLVRPQWRATTAATCGILTSLVALGLGPVIFGLLVDALTALELGRAGFATVSSACIHGGARTIADAAQAMACAHANVTAMRIGFIGFALAGVWPVLHFLAAARALRA